MNIMHNSSIALRLAAPVGWLALACTGCASLSLPSPSTPDVHAEHKVRKEDATKAFEEKRDLAQYQAAVNRWQEGDADGCRKSIEQLLTRNPEHREARQLHAELLLWQQAPAAALEQARQYLADHPDDAQAEHTLGMILEDQNQDLEAREHFQAAARLEPKNEVYALSAQTAAEAASLPPGAAAAHEASQGEPSSQGPDWQVMAEDAPKRKGNSAAPKRQGKSPAPRSVSNDSITDPLIFKAQQAIVAGDLRSADALLVRAVGSDVQDPQVAIRAGVMVMRYGHAEIAVDVLTTATERFPESATVWRALATAHLAQDNTTAARAALEKSLSIDNSDSLAHYLLSSTLRKLGEAEAADGHAEQARRLDPRVSPHR